MKIGKHFLGRFVEITWRDPNFNRAALKDAPKGRDALATWHERGVIDDITDGVVRVVHSAAKGVGSLEIDEIAYTVIDEALVESIVVYERQSQPALS